MTHVLDSDNIIPTCIKLLSVLLNHFLSENNVEPNNQDWLSAITNSLQLLEKLISVPESEGGTQWKYRGSVNKDYALEIIPIVSLLEFAITSDSI